MHRVEADYVELATCQFYGWAALNRAGLLPTRAQLERAERITAEYRQRLAAEGNPCKLIFVTPTTTRNGRRPAWAAGPAYSSTSPRRHRAAVSQRAAIAGAVSVREHSLRHIWYESFGFNRYRGDAWMPEPCRSCEEKERDHGGCQAFLLTGDADATDPVCAKSARHDLILAARRQAEEAPLGLDALTWRNQRVSRLICKA